MPYTIAVETISPRILAAVNRRVPRGLVGAVFLASQDAVWTFLRANPGLRSNGHNVFYYNHAGNTAAGLDVHFGVEIAERFEPHGEVACIETPGGQAAVTVHLGPYTGLTAAHVALRNWFRASGRTIGSWSLEIYGDWSEDENQLETMIVYALD